MEFDQLAEIYPDSIENSTFNIFSYDYDLEASLSTFDLYDLIPTALVYGITLITGLIGKS